MGNKRTLKLRSHVKHRPKVLEVETERSFILADKEGNEVLHTDNSNSTSPAVVIQTPYQLNPELTKREAKKLYMFHRWGKKELLELGMPERTLDAWLYQPTKNCMSWKQERDIQDQMMDSTLARGLARRFYRILDKFTKVAVESIEEIDFEEIRLTKPREFKDWMDVISKVKKELDIEEGKPREIKRHIIQSQEEANQLIEELKSLKDPFIDYNPDGQVN